MKVALTLEASGPIADVMREATEHINRRLKEVMDSVNFGDEPAEILIGIICVTPEFDSFFPERRPRYVKGPRTIKSKAIKGQTFTIEKSLSFDIKLDYQAISELPEEMVPKAVISEIVRRFPPLKRFKKFDAERFINSLSSIEL